MMNKQPWQDKLLEDHFNQTETLPPLPQTFSDVKRARGGYKVFSKGKWTFYAATCLTEAEVNDLEDWLIDLQPDRKAA